MADEKVTFQLAAKDKATATVKRLQRELGTMGVVAGKASGPLGKLSQATGGLVTPMTLGIGAAVGLGAALLGTVQGASDLNEEIDKSRVVFGPASSEMEEFAKSASAIGLSQQAALGAAGAFGNMFNTVGLAQGASQDMSEQMVRLAADMGSFNNIDPTEMLDKLRSGLSGEAEPLRRFGVLLSEASVKDFAMREGIIQTGQVLTEAQKVQARYGLILEQTSIQQGNYADTADSLANVQRTLSAEFQNISDEIGQALLPAMVGIAKWVRDDGIPAIRDFIAELAELSRGVVNTIDMFADMARTAAIWMGNMGQTIEDRANEIGVSVYDMKVLVQSGMNEMNLSFEEARVAAERELAGLPPLLTKAGVDSLNAALAGRPGMVTAMTDTMGAMTDEVETGTADWVEEVGKTPGEMAKALTDGLTAWQDSWAKMEEAATLEQQKGRRIRNNLARLASTELTEALASDDENRRLWAEQTRADLQAALTIDGYGMGANLAGTYSAGLRAGFGWVRTASGGLAAAIRGQIGIDSEPKDPTSPLRGITKWGGNIGKTIADGVRRRGVAAVRDAAGALAGATLVPSMGGAMAYAGGGGGLTVNFNSALPSTPGQAQAVVRAILPELRREQRRQGF